MENDTQLMGADTGSLNIHFAWLKEQGFVSSYKETKIAFDYDVDKMDDQTWEIHTDTSMVLDNVFEYDLRCSMMVVGTEEKIYTHQWLLWFLKGNMMQMRVGFEDQMTQANKHINVDELFQIEKELEPFADSIWESGKWKPLGDEAKNIFEKSYTLRFYQDTHLASIMVSNVMNDIFYWNPHFDRLGNQDRLKNYIHAPAFYTLNTQLIKFCENQQPFEVKWKYYIIFLLSVDCVCHLMLSDHAPYLEPRLKKMGVTKEMVKQFLKWAQMYMSRIKQNMKETKVNIEVLNMPIEWEKLVW